jgi:hypothetical protein
MSGTFVGGNIYANISVHRRDSGIFPRLRSSVNKIPRPPSPCRSGGWAGLGGGREGSGGSGIRSLGRACKSRAGLKSATGMAMGLGDGVGARFGAGG